MADRPYRVYRGRRRVKPLEEGEPRLRLPEVAGVAAHAPASPPAAAPEAPRRRGAVILPPADAPPPIAPSPQRTPPRAPAQPGAPRGPRRVRPGRLLAIVASLVVLGLGAWLVVGYLAFRASVEDANARLEALDPTARQVLSTQRGLPLSQATNVLVLGADRTGRADSMQIMRTDPDAHLVSTLAIPRDLRVEVPGRGTRKLNEAYALGGPSLAIRTVQGLTGLPIHHVVVVDFKGFRQLIDAVGGVELDSPQPLRSTFDGITYRFPRGRVELDGRRALAYARIRKNELNRSDSDVTRGVRQQQVIAALKDRLVSPGTLFRLRSVGRELAGPLATDLSANEILALGWVEFRSQRKLSCNLGGEPTSIGGVSYLTGDGGGNRRVLGEFLGRTAVQPVRRTQIFAPACRAGG